jgi:hypothetical protein
MDSSIPCPQIGNEIEVKWKLDNGKYAWFKGKIVSKFKKRYKVKYDDGEFGYLTLNRNNYGNAWKFSLSQVMRSSSGDGNPYTLRI